MVSFLCTGPMFKVNPTRNTKGIWGADHRPNVNPWDKSTTPAMVPLLGVLVLVLILSVLSMMAVVAWWKFKRESKNVNEPKGGALTYTNPTYSASNSDVNTDRKPFTWRRLHSDNVHQVGCLYTFVQCYHVQCWQLKPSKSFILGVFSQAPYPSCCSSLDLFSLLDMFSYVWIPYYSCIFK